MPTFLPTHLRTPSFVTVALAIAIAAAISTPVQAQHKHYATTPAQQAQAQAVSQSQGIPESELLPNAPDRYTVKRGNTLWGISGLYLKSPWKWPALWGMNKAQIANPHLIYPGQVLVLTRVNGRATLGLADGVDGMPEQKLKEQKLSPSIRSEPILPEPLTSINLDEMHSFLSQPLIVDEQIFKKSGYVLTGPENRVYTSAGDLFYARGLPVSEDGRYQLYRPSKPLHDPDTGAILAYEAYYLGEATIVRPGDPTQLKITVAKEELSRGDRLMPYKREPALNAVPHAPDAPIKARVMSSYSGVQYAGSNMIVSLNKGRTSNIEIGHVLAVWRTGEQVVDKELEPKGFWDKAKNKQVIVQLPDEQYGQVVVFRVFENVSYALVVGTTRPVKVGDTLTQP
jgi:LysM domain